MRVLIIGGTGFIGPYVGRDLHNQGHEVTVLHRGQHESDFLREVRHIRTPDAAMPLLRFPGEVLRVPLDVVIHMIPMGQADARAAVEAFTGRAQRLIALSSGDVYRAYGRLTGLEPGPPEQGRLKEDSPLRTVLYPYRAQAKSPTDLSYFYEKILVEREVLGNSQLPATVLRLPKVYGRGNNADLATIYAYRNQPEWRWTHGYVENVASAIVLAAVRADANGVYNVGEENTPRVGERLRTLPPSTVPASEAQGYDFRNHIVYDTTRIRDELGYSEPVSYEEGLRRTLTAESS